MAATQPTSYNCSKSMKLNKKKHQPPARHLIIGFNIHCQEST